MRQRAKNFATPAQVLGEGGIGRRIKDGMRLYRVWDLWQEIAGESLARHALPSRWHGRKLIVRVEHAAWVQELGFIKQTIIDRISRALPEMEIKDVRFEVGKLPDAPKGATRAAPSVPRKLTDDELEFVEQAAKEIPDEEVREAARSAMKKGFQVK